MQSRVLAHGRAPRSTHNTNAKTQGESDSSDERDATPGYWCDLSRDAQFLIDLEFLSRHSSSPAQVSASKRPDIETSCVYTQHPPYLDEMARRFPWIHFYTFVRPMSEIDDYDPAQPSIVKSMDFTLQTDQNKTTSPFRFDKDSATILSKTKQTKPEQQTLLMICHGESSVRQMILHTLLRPDFSLLDICGTIPEEYLDGELVFPISIPPNKTFMCLIAYETCKAKPYKQRIYQEEVGKTSSMGVAAIIIIIVMMMYWTFSNKIQWQTSFKTHDALQTHMTETVVFLSSTSTPDAFTQTSRATRRCL